MLQKSIVKYIQSLQHKKERDASGCFVAEGPKVVVELLKEGVFACQDIFATEKWWQQEGKEYNQSNSFQCHAVDEDDLKKISGMVTPHAVLAVFRKRETPALPDLNGLVLVLDDLQDPGNMGTIIRSADWFGITTILCSKNSVEIYNPKVVQSTMASLGRINIHYLDLHTFLQHHPQIPAFAATLAGASPVAVLKNQKDCLLIIGNESRGVSDEIRSLCQGEISIPRIGLAESLNASIAASILMYAYKS
jgi:TrmH family RNA methyltransferase